jgi:putative hydrolase of the HAD superfamily
VAGGEAGRAVETVLLDAGGVLVYPNWTRISDALRRHDVHVSPEALARAEPLAKRQLDTDRTIAATNDASRGWLYFDLILTAAGIPVSDATTAALEELQAYHRESNLWELVPAHVAPTLAELRRRGLTLAVVSNANGTLCRKFDSLGLTAVFGCVLDSCDVQLEKPDPKIFHLALERIGGRPETAIHIGDFYHIDVVGARSAGIRPVLLDEAGLYADADCQRIRSFPEILDLISTF